MNRRLLERVRSGLVGEGVVLDGPYGARRITYADHTASGRPLDFVEEFISRHVLPWYANTHTESSVMGARTGALREQARAAVHRGVGGGPDDVVLFCGSGATAAVNKLVGILGLRIPDHLDDAYGLSAHIPAELRPVVFVGPYEHHSNELPWRETIADTVTIGTDASGHVDLDNLRAALIRYAGRPLRIGSFSAASNVTGILTDVAAVSTLLREHGALALWDYAAAGPYVPIRMRTDRLDAVFLSPHKFAGGPQTPGVLVLRRDLLTNRVPVSPGGGTVAFVAPHRHRYLDDPVAREEGGTPAIVESIRAGLAFTVKEAIGTDLIGEREEQLWRRVRARWAGAGNIQLLGDLDVDRLPILSFQINTGQVSTGQVGTGQVNGSRALHHNFVAALLNDLFGIQARGGCSCAGPYGHRLLGIDDARSRDFQDQIRLGWEGVKPGWTRLSLNYLASDAVADYLADAVALVARDGARLLPDYHFDPRTGAWRHRDTRPSALCLGDLLPGGMPHDRSENRPEHRPGDRVLGEGVLSGYLDDARALFAARPDAVDGDGRGLVAEFERLRWFLLPDDCLKPL